MNQRANTHITPTDATSALAGDPTLPELERRQKQFRRFAAMECGHDALYVALCELLAQRPDALALLDLAHTTQRRPNLLLAALHDVVLAGDGGALADYYASVDGHRPPDAALGAALDSVLAQQAGTLRHTIAHRSTQTNEIGRCAVLWPALGEIARRCRQPQLALLDFGCSAGLNLGVDHFAYRYGAVNLGAPVQADRTPVIDCHPLHGHAPPAPPADMHIAHRAGLDLQPVDVRDAQSLRWLQACLWPQDRARAQRLNQAAAIVAQHRWPLISAADGVAAVERWLDGLPTSPTVQAVVLNSWVLAYFSADALSAHVAQMHDLVQRRGVAWLSAEGPGLHLGDTPASNPTPADGDAVVGADELANGSLWWLTLPGTQQPTTQLLARSHAHGRWVDFAATLSADLRAR